MNPPSAIANAMGRDRKPFTYTPGGIDLSEIKSEKMAKRLMRNAMNQGVPEVQSPTQYPTSPTTPTTPVLVPNYNCLPVQVFPTFQLPANPKSLLRTRSIPARPRDIPEQNEMRQYQQSLHLNELDSPQENTNNVAVNSRPVSMFSTMPSQIIDRLKSLETSEPNNVPKIKVIAEDNTHDRISFSDSSNTNGDLVVINTDKNGRSDFISRESDAISTNTQTNDVVEDEKKASVNVVKKQSKKTEQKTEVHTSSQNQSSQNQSSQNGDDKDKEEPEAELTVQLPTKKVGTKTETKVEVTKKTLADGTVEEITTTTTTKTSPDGKKEITTKTAKKIFPKETEEEEEYEEEEEQEESGVTVHDVTENGTSEVHTVTKTEDSSKQNSSILVKNEEHSESTETSTKKVMFVENTNEEHAEEQEQEQIEIEEDKQKTEIVEIENEEEEEEVVEDELEVEDKVEEIQKQEKTSVIDYKTIAVEVQSQKQEEEEEKEEEEEEVEEEEVEEEEEYEETEDTQTETKSHQTEKVTTIVTQNETSSTVTTETEIKETKQETTEETKEESVKEIKEEVKEAAPEQVSVSIPVPETKPREIPVLFDKVEDIEIKPIGNLFSKTHTETTEISTNQTPLNGPSGLATELQRIENITITSKTTKTLDHAYEQIKQQGIPTQKTYFAPGRDRVSISPSKVYEPSYPSYQPPQPPTERRHSLLLERLSTERQLPPQEHYQNQQTYENQTTRQWSQEPQSEILIMPNVKPSAISKNQQWYQQSTKENEIYNNTNTSSTQSWSQPVPQPAPQPAYQAPVQSPQQPQHQPQTYYEPQPQPEPLYQYQPPQQTNLPNHYSQNYSNTNVNTSNTLQHQHSFPSYAPKPTTWNNNQDYSNYNTQLSYQNNSVDNTQRTQQYSSGYVPPPWEQDSSYSTAVNTSTSYYQTVPSNDSFKPSSTPAWNSNPATPVNNKFTKPPPLAYVPPAPNQSFVKPVKPEQTKQAGRKTYYSEYERRYISVPESTYVPGSNKFQAQPNPSPQYYYDNNEPEEKQEPAWRKELREFTEKSSTTQYQSEQSNVKPPWEEDKYVKPANPTYTTQPSWTQTLRPRSTYESFESSEYVTSSEWPKNTNTIGRNRPLSYIQSNNEPLRQERSRGVSVDRYNANVYQSPAVAEHPPVQSHTLTPMSPGSVPHSNNFHNPNVPAYHSSRTSAEPREQSLHSGTRVWADSRASPVQSRSFKYLQWITGTDD